MPLPVSLSSPGQRRLHSLLTTVCGTVVLLCTLGPNLASECQGPGQGLQREDGSLFARGCQVWARALVAAGQGTIQLSLPHSLWHTSLWGSIVPSLMPSLHQAARAESPANAESWKLSAEPLATWAHFPELQGRCPWPCVCAFWWRWCERPRCTRVSVPPIRQPGQPRLQGPQAVRSRPGTCLVVTTREHGCLLPGVSELSLELTAPRRHVGAYLDLTRHRAAALVGARV